jgi:CRP-like cAMP-binding protein
MSAAETDSSTGNGNGFSLLISHESTFRAVWDVIIFMVTVFICVVVPLRIGFQILAWAPWAAPDVIVDLLQVADIVINFLTTYEEDGELVRDTGKIRWKYVSSWFFADLISVLPFEIVAAGVSYNPLMRVNRMVRMGRLIYYFVSWEKISTLKPSVIRILKSIFVIVFLAHLIGCLFFLVILIEGEDATADFTGSDNITDRPLASQYLRSFYWAFVTMTGYNNTNPNTQLETMFCIFVTMIGISVFATIIGTVGSLVTNLDSSKLYFRQKMDGINDYMKYKRIPQELQDEVRNYYSYLWKSGKGLDKNKVLDDLPPYLKNKMNVYLNSEIIRKVSLFQQCKDDQEFISEVVKCLKARVCLPNSFVVRKGEMGTEMYFISRGELNVVNDQDKVVFTLRDGGFFGEIALLYDTKRTASIVARTYCDMFILTKEDFKKVLKKFPQQSKGIKEIAKERFQGIVDAEKKKEEEAKAAKAAAEAAIRGDGGAAMTVEAEVEMQPKDSNASDRGQSPQPNGTMSPVPNPLGGRSGSGSEKDNNRNGGSNLAGSK